MPGNAPYHYEAPTRVQDHQVLANELCRASYKFYLLSHVFNVHRGIKFNLSDVEKVVTQIGKSKAKAFIDKFNAYLNQKYPHTNGSCPSLRLY